MPPAASPAQPGGRVVEALLAQGCASQVVERDGSRLLVARPQRDGEPLLPELAGARVVAGRFRHGGEVRERHRERPVIAGRPEERHCLLVERDRPLVVTFVDGHAAEIGQHPGHRALIAEEAVEREGLLQHGPGQTVVALSQHEYGR